MLHKEIIGLALLLFLGWVFVSSSGTERIQHFCAPVGWVGNVAVSTAALASPDSQKSLGKTMDKVVYGCEYMTWRLFYQSAYTEYMASKGTRGIAAPVPEVRAAVSDVEPPAPATGAAELAAQPVPKDAPAPAVAPTLQPAVAEPALPPAKPLAAKPVRVIE